jgi:RNA polymerase sigma-70 factor (ECF subfamily)
VEAALRKSVAKAKEPVRRRRASQRIRETLVAFAQTRERLARLPDDLRLPLTLVVIEGLSYADAASRLGVPVSVLMERLALARGSLSAMVAMSAYPLAAE